MLAIQLGLHHFLACPYRYLAGKRVGKADLSSGPSPQRAAVGPSPLRTSERHTPQNLRTKKLVLHSCCTTAFCANQPRPLRPKVHLHTSVHMLILEDYRFSAGMSPSTSECERACECGHRAGVARLSVGLSALCPAFDARLVAHACACATCRRGDILPRCVAAAMVVAEEVCQIGSGPVRC